VSRISFRTPAGRPVTAVTAAEMREVDRVAVEDVGVELLQMMENAGRTLASHVRDAPGEEVVVVAGNGGNGGGGLACARHLVNRGASVRVVLDRPSAQLTDAAAHQRHTLSAMGVPIGSGVDRLAAGIGNETVVVDALVGYGLGGELRDPASAFVERINDHPGPVISLDVPSGRDATTGEPLGTAVRPDRTVTLALPKTGLEAVEPPVYLADIGIPAVAYDRLDIPYANPFGDEDWVEVRPGSE